MHNQFFIEEIVKQTPKVFWFCGLSGAGKTTLARAACSHLLSKGHLVKVLDGDELRKGLNHGLGFSDSDRLENIRRTAETASILASAGVVVVVSLISPLAQARQLARQITGEDNFYEIYINAPLQTVINRDTKGYYKLAAEGKFPGLTGVDAPFDVPQNPDLELRTDLLAVEESLQKLLDFIEPRIARKTNNR